MHYLITGGTGFIGTALIEALLAEGHSATVLSRQRLPDTAALRYVADLQEVTDEANIDIVVNLAGASLAGARWTEGYKQEILSSRLGTTEKVTALIERLNRKPRLLLSASAIGYYGHHGDELLGEDGAVEPGFSAALCQQWESAAEVAAKQGVRVCLLRLGVVLDRNGGAMEEMARPFKFGIANWLGSGHQWLSWVHRRDVVAAIGFLRDRPDLAGAFNITAPEPVTSRGFCSAMKRYKRTLLTAPVPAPVMRLLVGEMAEELLLNGQRVVPERLAAAGFQFGYANLDAALEDIFQAS